MAFGRHNYNHWSDYIVPIRSYEDALGRFNSIKPVRGDVNECRPLGRRSDKYMHITKTGDVVTVWRGSEGIEFHPDNTVVLNATRWVKSPQFTSCVLRSDCRHSVGRFWVTCEVEGVGTGYMPLKRNESKTFKRTSTGSLLMLDPVFPTKHFVNKKKLNEVKKKYAGFIKYVSAVTKLRGQDGYTLAELENNENSGTGETFLKHMASGSHEDYYKAFLFLAAQDKYELCADVNSWRCIKDKSRRVRDTLNRLLLKHNKHVLEKQEVKTLKIVKDPNAWASEE